MLGEHALQALPAALIIVRDARSSTWLRPLNTFTVSPGLNKHYVASLWQPIVVLSGTRLQRI